jgi:hypothetical protein
MQGRGFLALVALTALVVIAAVALSIVKAPPKLDASAGSPALPQVSQRAPDIGSIVVQRDKGTVTITRGASGWSVAERNNYPADPAKVRQALVGLAELKLVEAKTRKAESYPRLEVEDVKDGAKSALVRVKHTNGGVLAELIIGKRRFDRLGAGADAVYVRRPGDPQAWLAQGSLDVTGEAKDWLDKKVVSVPAAKVKQVSVKQPDGSVLTIQRESEGGKVSVADGPADAKWKNESTLAEPLAVLDGLELSDVAAVSENPPPDNAATAEFVTFDGLTVTSRTWEKDGTHWVKLSASGNGSETIEPKVKDWTFAIPQWKANNFKTKLEDLVETPKSS